MEKCRGDCIDPWSSLVNDQVMRPVANWRLDRRWSACLLGVGLMASHSQVQAEKPGPSQMIEQTPPDWASIRKPSSGPAQAIGGYSSGCVRGAQALPLHGLGFQQVKPWRSRNFGHPQLVDLIRDLGAQVKEQKWGRLMVGDLGQARGGPAPSGHKSHQSGLDVDIWYWHPARAVKRPLSTKGLKSLKPPSLVDKAAGRVNQHANARVRRVLQRAALDDRVERIFVHPRIKQWLCTTVSKQADERAWLAKIRPWWGHDRHFHVRLACPSGSPQCKAQTPLKAGDGCAGLAWWFDAKAQAERKKDRAKYRANMGKPKTMPSACEALRSAG